MTKRIAIVALMALLGIGGAAGEDIVAQKRAQYLRILTPPQERMLDRTKWLELCNDQKSKQADFARLEDLMDARSRLYSLAMRVEGQVARDSLARGYRALAEMDMHAVKIAIKELGELEKEATNSVPLTEFNPFSWIKCFTQWGYIRHPDGCSVYEPMPWNMVWQDGFRCNVAQDRRVVIANSAGHPYYYETRFLEPMTDVSFTRDWVSTRWHMPGGETITFSLLTPVVDIEGTDTIRLSGFSSQAEWVTYIGPSAEPWYVQLSDTVKIESEIIPSALMDFSKRPQVPTARPWGNHVLPKGNVRRPWLKLYSVSGNWTLYLLLGEQPASVCWEKGVFTLKLVKKGYVGLLRPPANLHDGEHAAIVEFFAQHLPAYPERCEEKAGENRAEWHYRYRIRPNAWNLQPRAIAPIPPLAHYAGAKFDDAKTVKYPTKWGLLRYVEGDTCRCEQPRCPIEPREFRGMNISIKGERENIASMVTNGLRFVRAFAPGNAGMNLAQMCDSYDQAFSEYSKLGIKAFFDPHVPKEYEVRWRGGISPTNDAAFVRVWDEFSKIGAKHKDVVVGYDLYNEPGLLAGSEERWRELCGKAAAAILRNHPEARIYYPGLYGGNQNGLFNLKPLNLAEGQQVITYHMYSPHSFTHQKVQTHDVNDTCVFYPAWAPAMNWSKNHFGGTTVDWFDKWTLGALLLPAFEHYADYRTPLNCGEFAVIGYANAKASWGAFEWTRDAIELFEHGGHSWNIWNWGFGMGNAKVRKYVLEFWQSRNKRRAPLP